MFEMCFTVICNERKVPPRESQSYCKLMFILYKEVIFHFSNVTTIVKNKINTLLTVKTAGQLHINYKQVITPDKVFVASELCFHDLRHLIHIPHELSHTTTVILLLRLKPYESSACKT